MEYTHLGRTGLSVSRLCLGTMNFGWTTTEDDGHKIMDRAHEVGVNFFDTANAYGGPESGKGATESIIGRWFARGEGRRERTVLATKLYADMDDWPNSGRLSALNIRRACEASLRRLQTDYIDLYQMHHVDLETPWEEIWEAMDVLVTSGKVVYVGSSNFGGWHITKAQEQAARRPTLGLVSEQSLYNLIERRVELEVLPACEDYGVGVIPWSPLAGGLLGGVLDKERAGHRRRESHLKPIISKHRKAIKAYEEFCAELGADPGTVALAWLLTRPAVTAPIIGPRTMDHLDGALDAVELELGADALARLDEIFPGPGPAPQAYAW